jgi:hypothetical protein
MFFTNVICVVENELITLETLVKKIKYSDMIINKQIMSAGTPTPILPSSLSCSSCGSYTRPCPNRCSAVGGEPTCCAQPAHLVYTHATYPHPLDNSLAIAPVSLVDRQLYAQGKIALTPDGQSITIGETLLPPQVNTELYCVMGNTIGTTGGYYCSTVRPPPTQMGNYWNSF